MNKKRSEKATRTRQEILNTAVSLFQSHGIKEVSISTIMSTLDLTPGGFYNHFESKEVLAQEACESAFKDALHLWQSTIGEASIKSTPLHTLACAYIDVASKGLCPVIAFSHDVSGAAQEKSLSQTYMAGAHRLLCAATEAALASGKSNDEALVHFAAMLGAGLLASASGSVPWVKEVVRATESSMGYPSSSPSNLGLH